MFFLGFGNNKGTNRWIHSAPCISCGFGRDLLNLLHTFLNNMQRCCLKLMTALRWQESIVNQSHPNLIATLVHQHLIGPLKLPFPFLDFVFTVRTPHWSLNEAQFQFALFACWLLFLVLVMSLETWSRRLPPLSLALHHSNFQAVDVQTDDHSKVVPGSPPLLCRDNVPSSHFLKHLVTFRRLKIYAKKQNRAICFQVKMPSENWPL